MHAAFSDFLVTVVDYAWGLPLVILLIGGGAFLTFVSRLQCLKGAPHAFKLITGKFHHDGDEKSEGQLSHFKALTNALSATLGMGNIAGVAIAIAQGGPGAILWMWVAAIVGMNTKFFEATLSLLYRGHDFRGEPQGGPMYYIESGLGKNFKFLAFLFALFGMLGTLSIFNANQMASFMDKNYTIDSWISGVVMAIAVGAILMGGVRRIGSFTSRIVPLMCGVYILGSLGVILLNFSKVPGVFMSIFTEALNPSSVWGGITGASVMAILKVGVKRAAFSNEAGVGTAPMAHGNAKTKEPVAEGLVAMVGPFLDTIIVCTMTALVILISLTPDELMTADDGVLMTQSAFFKTYGDLGTHVLGVAIFLFSFSTLVGMANYNKKCWDYLFKGKSIFGRREVFVIFYIATIVYGSIQSADDAVNLIDIGLAFMAIPNMTALILLSGKVKMAMQDYFSRYQL